MKQKILAAVAMICAMTANAEEKTALKIWVESDNFQAYNISAMPVIKHVDGQLKMCVNNKVLGTYAIYDKMKITFGEESQEGDANCDQEVTMADANTIVNKFLTGDVKNINVTAADANCDGIITMADANATVNLFLNNE